MVCYVRTAAEGHRLRSLVLAETNQRTRRAAVLETVGAFAILANSSQNFELDPLSAASRAVATVAALGAGFLFSRRSQPYLRSTRIAWQSAGLTFSAVCDVATGPDAAAPAMLLISRVVPSGL